MIYLLTFIDLAQFHVFIFGNDLINSFAGESFCNRFYESRTGALLQCGAGTEGFQSGCHTTSTVASHTKAAKNNTKNIFKKGTE